MNTVIIENLGIEETIINNLLAEMTRRGITHKEMARKMDISESTFNRKLKTWKFTLPEICKACSFMIIPFSELIRTI